MIMKSKPVSSYGGFSLGRYKLCTCFMKDLVEIICNMKSN